MIRIQNSRSLLTKTSVHEEKLYKGQCLSRDWKRQVGSKKGELEMRKEQKYGKTAGARRRIRTVGYPKKYDKRAKTQCKSRLLEMSLILPSFHTNMPFTIQLGARV